MKKMIIVLGVGLSLGSLQVLAEEGGAPAGVENTVREPRKGSRGCEEIAWRPRSECWRRSDFGR